MSLSEDDLANELRSFAWRFVASHRFDQLAEMLTVGEGAHEYHNETDKLKYFETEAMPTYRESDEGGDYIAVLFSVMDLRAKGKLGSAYSPLSCFGFVRSSGQVDFSAIGNDAVPGCTRDF